MTVYYNGARIYNFCMLNIIFVINKLWTIVIARSHVEIS